MKQFVILLSMVMILASCNDEDKNDQAATILNNNWQFSEAGKNEWKRATVPGTIHTDLLNNGMIRDPFYRLNEKDQQWIDKKDWEYKTTFRLDDEMLQKKHLEMVFHGLDTYADVFLNGQEILSTDNMFRTWKTDVKPLLKPGENTLRVLLKSSVNIGLEKLDELGFQLPADNDQSENGGLGDKKVSIFTRKAGYHFGWDWGPRLVTSGIWRDIEINGWNEAKIESIQINQLSLSDKAADLEARMEITADQAQDVELDIENKDVDVLEQMIQLKPGTHIYTVTFTIENPQRWWPNGLGEQKLYPLEFELESGETTLDEQQVNYGIREIDLIRKPDEDGNGESFYFEVNGRPVFAKGANYIPNDIFLPRVSAEKYEHIIKSAAEAHMNMLRVWGGGIYENDLFYDLCDRYGIMVWQDFMFACAMYPGDDAFLENVRHEAIDNVKRLRNHPSLALWCGNNEIEAAWGPYDENRGWGWKQRHTPEERTEIWQAYDTLFHHILPEVIAQYDSKTPYWHSSPSAGMGKLAGYDTRSGDMHYWGVWHGQHPFSDFKKYRARFMSEYGFQSFPEFASVKKYTLPEDWDIESEVMASHQRSGIGNLRIRQYMEDHYIVPDDFEQLLYVGQLLQAKGIRTAIQAHRSDMPYCMGSLYWQLNDVWPVASWSSIDYYGKWKALHYAVKEAYKNTVVFIDRKDEKIGFTIVSDLAKKSTGMLKMKLMDFDGNLIWEKEMKAKIPQNNAQVVFEIPEKDILKRSVKNNVVLIADLEQNEEKVDRALFYFAEPKDLKLPEAEPDFMITKEGENILITIKSDKLVKNLMLIDGKENGHFSNNYFDVLPGEEVTVSIKSTLSPEQFKEDFRWLDLGSM